jgi:hypothetical protein
MTGMMPHLARQQASHWIGGLPVVTAAECALACGFQRHDVHMPHARRACVCMAVIQRHRSRGNGDRVQKYPTHARFSGPHN